MRREKWVHPARRLPRTKRPNLHSRLRVGEAGPANLFQDSVAKRWSGLAWLIAGAMATAGPEGGPRSGSQRSEPERSPIRPPRVELA